MRIMMEDTKLPPLGRNSHLVTLAPSSQAEPTAVVGYPKQTCVEGRHSYIENRQDRYLHKLVALRETLLREKDQFMSLQLPKSTDKHTGFWEAVMTDIAENSGAKRLNIKRNQTVFGSSCTDENRRSHLERLRRIRIMQDRRRLPPQLEPLQGIGLGARSGGKTKGSKRKSTSGTIPPTTYHVNWMRGSHVITPLANSDEVDKAISSWTLKHLRTVDAMPYSNMQSDLKFPSDIRELLRRTRRSLDSSIAQPNDEKLKKEEIKNAEVSPNTIADNRSEQRKPEDSIKREKETKLSKKQFNSSSSMNSSLRSFTPPPPPASSPTPILSTSAITPSITPSVSSSAKSVDATAVKRNRNLLGRSTVDRDSDGEDDVDISNRRLSKSNSSGSVEIVDRATSPIGFRLSQFESESPLSLSPTKSKRHIIVKIPHGVK